ncbi:MAG TPA: type II CAAX endopeptidase family protein [Candidatus Acidoferrum sp.]|nr:type II CAAX endopeptidase family protein [Candidatus Acidoferrum sp.]
MSAAPLPPIAPPEDRSRVAPIWHTFIFIVGIIGLTLAQFRQTQQMANVQIHNRVPLYVAMIVFELFMLLYTWIGVLLGKKRLRDLIRGKWNTLADFGRDIAIVIGFWIVVIGVLAVASRLLGTNATGLKAVKMLIPRTPAEMAAWILLSITAGFCEETIFRGYFQRQFFALTGKEEAAVILQACVFGSAHLYQGWKGALTITIYGILFGALAAWRKSLRPGMIQHAAQDTFSGIAGSFALRHHMF